MGSSNGNGGGGLSTPAYSESAEGAFRGHGGRRPRVLAHGGRGFKQMVADDTHLYWTDDEDGTVTRLPKEGGIPVVVAVKQARPGGIAISDGFLYWTNEAGGTVVRMQAGGGDVETIATQQDQPTCIAVRGNEVVWGNLSDVEHSTLMTGGFGKEPAKLASKQKYLHSIALDETYIYWTALGMKPSFANGSVMRMPRMGEEKKRKRFIIRKPETSPIQVVLDDDWIYWTSQGRFELGWDGTVKRRRKRGGKIDTLVTRTRTPSSLTVDATHVYWIEEFQSAIWKVAKGGGEPAQIVSSEVIHIFPDSLIVDGTCLYWAVYDSSKAGGAIWKIGK